MPLEISESFFARLAAQKCVAVVGAGFSAPAGYPLWKEFVLSVIGFAEQQASASEREVVRRARATAADGDLQGAIALLKSETKIDAQDLRDHIIGLFRWREPAIWPERERMANRLINLEAAPWAGVLTTNYDQLIESAIDGKHPEWHEVKGPTVLLAGALRTASRFFVKLHGDTWGDNLIISSDDYHRAYLASPLIETFLTALMLNYHLVFIGSSLEDELLRIRTRLCYRFEGQIPLAYALLPRSPFNERRDGMLRREAKIETWLYDSAKCRHSTIDDFLNLCKDCGDPIALGGWPRQVDDAAMKRSA